MSSAEIASLLSGGANFLAASSETLLLETKKEQDVFNLMARLGGTIKIGVVLDILDQIEPKKIAENIPRVHGKKSYFGFSFYKIDDKLSSGEFKNKSQKIKNLAMEIKNIICDAGAAARWVTSKEKNLSSVIVEKNKLLTETGAELVFLIGKEKIYLGKTLAVQEFENLSFRDYSRPARNMKVGLLPPKLAKVMINLANVKKSAAILDPFCGLATILGEASLMGYENLIGGDINAETLSGAKENLLWLAKNYQLPIDNYQLLEYDARHLSKKLSPHSIDAIITEPYLGPPLQGNESPEKIQQIIKELSDLYLAAFREFKKILKPDGKIVIAFPVFRTASDPLPPRGGGLGRGGEGFLPILDEIKKIGFLPADLLPEKFSGLDFLQITPRNSIIYSRPDQKVFREIFIFTH